MTNLYEVNLVEGGTVYINLSTITHFVASEKDGSFLIYPMELRVEAGSFMSAMAAQEVGMFGFNKPPFSEEKEEAKES